MVRLETPRLRPARRLTFLLVRLPMHVLSVVLLAGVGLNLANVVARYVFSAPIFWKRSFIKSFHDSFTPRPPFPLRHRRRAGTSG